MNLKQMSYLLIVAILAAVIFIWAGVFNISAKDKHWDITTAVLTLVRERSITVRAENITTPTNLSNPDMIAQGAKNYDAMCSQCHLAPAMKPTELNLGLYPQPPTFFDQGEAQHYHEHDPAKTFWTVKNGLKMTGMPAWGDFHTDEQIWQLVAFLSQADNMSAAEYRTLVGEGGHTHKPDMHHTTETPKQMLSSEQQDLSDDHRSHPH
ncbi:MAG: hypothetical protein ISEC1_P1044 [Thiomicrorhabdus sp.]|nr:MAG: hypothetical protein ISEC1_P1044 [Thiomicrorhabdus sp.]